MLTHPSWENVADLRHGFLDADDCRAAPDWARVLAAKGVHVPLARLKQVHGTTVLLADQATPTSEGDAVVATTPGVAVGIVTADCAPMLLRDRRGRAVAAVHAGWRGAAAGVVESTLATLSRHAGVEPSDVDAVIGPAAGRCCYEVGQDVRDALGDRAAAAFIPRRDRYLLDLRAAVRALAQRAGIRTVELLGPCTICDARYASYRRDGAAAGRQLSWVALA
jgi:YfiH family protein